MDSEIKFQSPNRMKSTQVPRVWSPNYSSCLMFDKKGRDLLTSLTVATLKQCSGFGASSMDYKDTVNEENVIPARLVIPDTMSCGCCQVIFSDREEQKNHYKCDWHRYNLHQKLRGQESVLEEDFEKLAATSDVSSISGSDEDDSEDEDRKCSSPMKGHPAAESEGASVVHSERKLPKVFFRNDTGELISLYRCLLHHKKEPFSSQEGFVKAASELSNKMKWMIVMVSAGHFASAIFTGKEVVEHKTFHRYTVRAKRGTAQSSRDKQGHAPKSAGARLRRYNEAALSQDVSELLTGWSDHINSCDLIFLRIPVNNRGMFYGGKNPLFKKDDLRIRVIPFPTRRPTFNELKRVHQMLASVESYGLESEMGELMPHSPPKVYMPETNELHIREPRPERKKKSANTGITGRPSQAKDTVGAADTQESKPVEAVEEDGDSVAEEVTDMELVESMQTVDFSHLKEFDRTPSPKKKNAKKKKHVSEKSDEASEVDEERIRWQNRLFTACKTGNVDSLQLVLTEIDNFSLDLTTKDSKQDSVVNRLNVPEKCTSDSHPVDSGNLVSSLEVEKTVATSIASLHLNGEVRSNSGGDGTASNPAQLSDKRSSEGEEEKDKRSVSSAEPVSQQPGVMCEQESSVVSVNSLLMEVLSKSLGDQGSTYLHVAAKHGHPDTVWALLGAGADPAIRDKSGKVPYLYGDSNVRNTFRRFMSSFPDRYDYTKAQVPSPLTAEMEAEKKQKNAEKRKQKKKALNERNKGKKALEAKAREENQEQERFLALSEREKRALAAERRLVQQQSEQSRIKPVLSRCWQCGSDITGKVPFEYADYKFCTTTCLREHRAKAAS